MKRLPYLLLTLMLTACSSIDCPVNSLVESLYEVCDSTGQNVKMLDTLSVFTTNANGEQVLLNKGTGLSQFHLQVSQSHPEDILVFCFDLVSVQARVTDTVWIKKEDHPHFESVDCNSAFFHTITDLKCTRHYIDSIVIINPSIDYNYETVHFRMHI